MAPNLRGDLGVQAAARRAALTGQLEEAEFGDIAIRPFALTYDGVPFSLVDESAPGRGSWAGLYPDPLGFTDPWDGTYSSSAPEPPVCPATVWPGKLSGLQPL